MFRYLNTRDNINTALICTHSFKQKLCEKEIKKRPFNRSIDDRQDKSYPSLPTPTRLADGFGLQEICPTCCAGFTPVTTGSPASTLWNSAIAIDFIYYIIIQKDFDLCLFDKLRFKLHLSKAVNLAFDVMVAIDKTYVLYLSTYLQ